MKTVKNKKVQRNERNVAICTEQELCKNMSHIFKLQVPSMLGWRCSDRVWWSLRSSLSQAWVKGGFRSTLHWLFFRNVSPEKSQPGSSADPGTSNRATRWAGQWSRDWGSVCRESPNWPQTVKSLEHMAWGRYFIRIILFRPHFSSEKNVNVAHRLRFLLSDSSEIWTQRRESRGGVLVWRPQELNMWCCRCVKVTSGGLRSGTKSQSCSGEVTRRTASGDLA